jgi:hypothetical protein
MIVNEAKTLLKQLQQQCAEACDIAKTAARNSKSLSGANYYGNKFHEVVVALSANENRLRKVVSACQLEDAEINRVTGLLSTIKSITANATQRRQALQDIKLICDSVLLSHIEAMQADPIPQTEQVLPNVVVKGTRGYLEKIILQANGCYEHQWFDACSVMIRKFIENLIILVYERNGKEDEIKDPASNNYFMLGTLIDRYLVQKYWSIGRETQTSLPLIKELGDRAAHTRHFVATKPDVDKALKGFRVAAEELLHHANLK